MAEQTSDQAAGEQAAIANLLLRCEDAGGPAPEYQRSNPDNPKPPVPIDSRGDEVFVVSELHLAEGQGADGRYDGSENFFCDSSFRRFLSQAHGNLKSTNAILTWIPIVEISSAELREDKTYSFLHLEPDASGKLAGILKRWEDGAGRAEPAIVIKRARE